MRRLALVSLPVLLLIAGGCGTLVRATEQLSLNQPWANYARVEVAARNGGVELRGQCGPDQDFRPQVRGGTDAGRSRAEPRPGDGLCRRERRAAGHFSRRAAYPAELRNKNVGADLVIEIPQPCAAKIETSNGSIRVEHLAGEVVLESSNGNLHALNVDGTVRAGTSNGRIECENVSGGVTAKSSNGGIAAQEVGGPCVLRTSNGDVRCVLAPTAQGDVECGPATGRFTPHCRRAWPPSSNCPRATGVCVLRSETQRSSWWTPAAHDFTG